MKIIFLAPGLLLVKLFTGDKKRTYRSPRQKPPVTPGLFLLSLVCWLALAGSLIYAVDKAGLLGLALDAGVEKATSMDEPDPGLSTIVTAGDTPESDPGLPAPVPGQSFTQPITVEQWLVILHTIPKSGRDEAERRQIRYRNAGLEVDIFDTDAFPLLKSDNWIIAIGPFEDRDSAAKEAVKAKAFITSDLMVRKGL